MARTSKDKTISIRLSQTMLEALDARAVLDEKDRAQVIREAIAKHLEINDEEFEEKINSLEKTVDKLQTEYQKDRKKTEALGKRVDEMSRLVTYCIERLPSNKT
ncbi:ribbon-helix-helix protein, CopG family [Cyanothece sp. BG0011]|uniref:ribbon-helix-helix protein, CopG family n=1 Tax=Cyanothece sp. BG0011 TaxID=2082950 RepID=UPI000D1F7A45|nr:ribbon-helix-helix protein, CopG family [Cyanothece sp. BG0011]